MRFRISLALCLSLLLIVGAVVFRAAHSQTPPPTLVTVDVPTDTTSEDLAAATAALTNDLTPVVIAPKENLTTTDLIGRQMMNDYLSLAYNGSATEANITSLADQYVNGIPALSASERVNLIDAKIVPDTKQAFENYAAILRSVNSESQAQLTKLEVVSSNFGILSPEMYAFAKNMSAIYARAANKLKVASVPASLSDAHVRLINNYLSNAAAFGYLARADNDTTTAFAGLVTFNQNAEAETPILTEMVKTMNAHGI